MTKGVLTSPWVYDSGDYQNNHIKMTFNFDGTLAITSARIDRDPGCAYTRILIGLGGDGKPDSSTRNFSVGQSVGRNVTAAELATMGINLITDLFGFQITAAP